jgi:hypothetical protein
MIDLRAHHDPGTSYLTSSYSALALGIDEEGGLGPCRARGVGVWPGMRCSVT